MVEKVGGELGEPSVEGGGVVASEHHPRVRAAVAVGLVVPFDRDQCGVALACEEAAGADL